METPILAIKGENLWGNLNPIYIAKHYQNLNTYTINNRIQGISEILEQHILE